MRDLPSSRSITGRGHRAAAKPALRAPGGFTLVELLVVAALALALTTAAAPAFVTWQMRDRVDAATRALLASFAIARAEALALGRRVFVCRTDAVRRCVPAGAPCAGRSHDWACGWAVVSDPSDVSHAFRVQAPMRDIAIAGAESALIFTPPVGLVVGGFRHFEVAPRPAWAARLGARLRRCVVIAAGGRARVTEGACSGVQ